MAPEAAAPDAEPEPAERERERDAEQTRGLPLLTCFDTDSADDLEYAPPLCWLESGSDSDSDSDLSEVELGTSAALLRLPARCYL